MFAKWFIISVTVESTYERNFDICYFCTKEFRKKNKLSQTNSKFSFYRRRNESWLVSGKEQLTFFW